MITFKLFIIFNEINIEDKIKTGMKEPPIQVTGNEISFINNVIPYSICTHS